jgi:hypothetical protein
MHSSAFLLTFAFLLFSTIFSSAQISILGGNYTKPKLSKSPITLGYTGLTLPGTTYMVIQGLESTVGPLKEFQFASSLPNSTKLGKPGFVVQISGSLTNGNVTLDPLPSSRDANTTFHLFQVARPTVAPFYTWLVSTSLTQNLDTWPTVGNGLDGHTGIFVDGGFVYGSGSLIKQAYEYKTVMAETIISVNDTVDCYLKITSTGIIRAAYLGGDFLFSGATKFDYYEETIFDGLVSFSPEAYILTLFGTNINPTITLSMCYNTSGVDVNANFLRYYRASGSLFTSSLVTYYSKYTCDAGCDICSPSCQQCSSGSTFGTSCLSSCASPGNDLFSLNIAGTDRCSTYIQPSITSSSMSYNNLTRILTFAFRGDYAVQPVAITIYSGDISSYLTSDMSLLFSPVSLLATQIYTSDVAGNITGTIGTVQNLAASTSIPVFTLVANLLLSNSIKIHQFNAQDYSYLIWTSYMANGAFVTYWAPTYIYFEVFYSCTTSPCQVTIENDGYMELYLNGASYSPATNTSTVTQTDLSLPQTGLLSGKISGLTYFKVSSPATLYARSDFIYNSQLCIDDVITSYVKSCDCVFPCVDCLKASYCKACPPGMTLSSGSCNCNSVMGTIPDTRTKSCQCPLGYYLNPVLGNCTGICPLPCQTCLDGSGVCSTCLAPAVKDSNGYCICNLPWNHTGNGALCDNCLGYFQLSDCVISCFPNATVDNSRKECIICSSDWDCRNIPETPYCSLNTTYCVGFKASIQPLFINKINPTLTTTISAGVVDFLGISANLADFQYTWWLDFDLRMSKVGNSLKIYSFTNVSGYPSSITINLLVTHIATGNSSIASATINVNKRPVINAITTSPSTGYAWQDIFNFTVVVTDSESDFPITTIWYYYGSDMQRITLAQAGRTISYMGMVPMGSQDIGLPYRALLLLSVDVYDSSGLLQTQSFAIITRIIYLSLNQISNIISTANTTNTSQLVDVSVTVDNLKTQDRDSMKYSNNPCLVNCHGNGLCQSKKCKCNDGFVLPDCSMTMGDFLHNLVVKGQIIKYLSEVCTPDNLNTNQTIFYCFQIMDSITSNIYLSPEEVALPVMYLAKDILNWIKELYLDQTTLDQIGALINNLLDYPAQDCGKTDRFGFTVLQNIKYFMDHLHLLLVRKAFIDQGVVSVLMSNFDLYSQRLSTSQIPGISFTNDVFLSTDPYIIFPSFGLLFNQPIADIQFIHWNMDIFKCRSKQPKGVTMVLKKDLSMDDLDYSLASAYQIVYPEVPSGFLCPGSCNRQSAFNPTICGCLEKQTLAINSFILRNTPISNVQIPETYDNSGAVVLNAVLGSICLVHMIAGILLDMFKKTDLIVDLNRLSSLGQFFAYIFVYLGFLF